ncbi:hypothetical protein BDV06DRAFT_217998 [Aspergillus oleicola]
MLKILVGACLQTKSAKTMKDGEITARAEGNDEESEGVKDDAVRSKSNQIRETLKLIKRMQRKSRKVAKDTTGDSYGQVKKQEEINDILPPEETGPAQAKAEEAEDVETSLTRTLDEDTESEVDDEAGSAKSKTC